MPTSVSATARFKDTGVDVEVVTIMQHSAGAVSSTVSALDIGMANTAQVLDKKARIEIDDSWYTPTSFCVVDHQNVVLEEFDSPIVGRGMQYQAQEMERLARWSGSSSLIPPEQSVDIMTLLDLIRNQIGLVYPLENSPSCLPTDQFPALFRS
ncbi:hypothetical protein LAV84_29075 [Rhizobium sp. VS19-DR104.2]|uniref:hypothetical protein n=1 Tax=unclassified Rhizobium TaxID=2613769 RepID=UPI001C5A8E7B|nr:MULTISPECIES: hypothetical protein [unclassified Rhizobium]MBZ5763508.1 hypothetical protein [Rhizobium sp. VS19-DR96]MBZ5769450.1 hypothetical protein [Rhizobium sp. VS19-DR129.2]MBZ5776973.1 hypothetical protein [Rhizobium sp. VS19-DRK62.2]MBZ5788041.1 hypothetical protein [Rhizobium sp. VS19-DR121]MBZ5805576.1 hypothetical protein [Rhizobium sp. VS19-DR181]